MTTRAQLRSRILRDLTLDLDASTWSTFIDEAISDAITFYQPKRFYFNESRTLTFNTVAGTDSYTFNTQNGTGTIGAEFYRLDEAFVRIGNTQTFLTRVEYDWLEDIADNNTGRGQPYNYAYIARGIRLYPNPDKVYTVRFLGHIKMAAPADDVVDDNVWMNEGFELIRARAKGMFAMHVINDEALASRMAVMERSARASLMEATHAKIGDDTIIPTVW